MSEVEEILGLSEEDLQDLPMEQKKKAINLQDLIYVKGYINSKHNNHKNEMDAKYDKFVDEVTEFNNNFKSEMVTDYNTFKTEAVAGIDEKVESEVNKNLADVNGAIDDILDGTTTAGDATKVQGVNLADDNVAKIGDYIFSKAKLIWNTEIALAVDPNLNSIYMNTTKAPSGFLSLLQPNRKYKLVMCQSQTTYDKHVEFEGEFKTIESAGSMEMRSSNIFGLPYSATQAGDLALFTINGVMYQNTSGTYEPTTATFQLSLITNTSDKLNSTVINDYAYKIVRMYEIVE